MVAAEITMLAGTALSAAPGASSADRWSRAPQSLMDEMVLAAASRGEGRMIIPRLNDEAFKGMEKWSYTVRSQSGVLSEVHYVRDPKTGALMDFKFKQHGIGK